MASQKTATHDVSEAIKDNVNKAAQGAESVKGSLSAKSADLERVAKGQYNTVRKKAKENPLITLGVVFAAGALASKLVASRRS